MTRLYLVSLVVITTLTGCGNVFAPMGDPSDNSGAAPANVVAPGEQAPQSNDITLRFFDAEPSPSGEKFPSFEVHSLDFTQVADEVWTFRGAEATIYARDGENIDITAGEATMNNETQSAVMKGEVVLKKGTMTMTLEDLEWSNDERIAKSDHPLTIVRGDTHIMADSVIYYPDEDRVVLPAADGHIVNAGSPEQ